jgi:asparagine synthase (glutamine-hydrolysing)
MSGFFVQLYNMCGIAGIITNPSLKNNYKKEILTDSIKKMTNAIAHRGPDGEGFWINNDATVAFGHRHLSIIDGGNAANQPMQRSYFTSVVAEEKRYTITFSGQVLNYIELKETLYKNGYRFQSKSVAEVVLAAYNFWEEGCLRQFDGMFAFTIWDNEKQQLFAARDRFGEMPFYFYHDKEHFIFGSEMKALWATGVPKTADNKMLLNYLALGYVQNAEDKGQTFFENISSLPPSHYLFFDAATFDYKINPYFKIDKEISITINADAAIKKFDKLLSSAVSRCIRGDVATGCNLTGGPDSAAILSYIAQHSSGNKHPGFSALFPAFQQTESKYIQSVTKRFQLKNHQAALTVDGLLSDFEKLCYHQEEPFPSSVVYAQYKVYELASQYKTKVILDGTGANETLAGYHKYIHWYLQQLISRKKITQAFAEKKFFKQNDIEFKWGIGNYLATYLPAHAAIMLEQIEYNKIARQPDLSKDFINALHGREWEGIHKPIITKLNDILYFNTVNKGLEEQLRFSDRNSMAHGLEVRRPFLNHELIEFIFSLPANFKLHEGWTKWILRKAVNKKLPKEVVWQKDERNFAPPQKTLLENAELFDYIREAKKKLISKGILKPGAIDKPTISPGQNEANNFDWRYLCAAQIL